MRITVNVAEIAVDLTDVGNPSIDAVETLLNRAVGAALLGYAGMLDIEALAPANDDEEESTTPDEE